MNEIRQSLGEIPLVEDELRKAAGDEEVRPFSFSFYWLILKSTPGSSPIIVSYITTSSLMLLKSKYFNLFQ
jgi:hypothetical protein